MSDLYVLTVWKNGWLYAAPINAVAEVPDAVISYSKTMTRKEAMNFILETPVHIEGTPNGRQSKQGQRPQL